MSETHPVGRKVNWVLQILILFSIISFSIETVPGLTEKQLLYLHLIDTILVFIFSVEYILRVYTAPKPLQYIFSFFGLIDLLTIIPFYLHLSFGFVSIRALRFLRIFRILRMLHYNKAISHFRYAMKLAREELILFMFFITILIYFAAVGIYLFEHPAQPEKFSSIFTSLWWSVCTLTTVGYGDIFPITTGGRIFTFFLLLAGLSIISIPAGIISSALSRSRKEFFLFPKHPKPHSEHPEHAEHLPPDDIKHDLHP
jgi:voltage-gated potassium channel